MASITIRDLDESIKARLRIQAAQHGVSMEAEARQILRRALSGASPESGLGTRVAKRFAAAGNAELAPVARSQPRPAPDFGEQS